MLEGYLIASCVKESTHKIKKKRKKKLTSRNIGSDPIQTWSPPIEEMTNNKTKKKKRECTQTSSRSRMNDSTRLLICSAIAPRHGARDDESSSSVSLFTAHTHTHTHFPPYFVRWRGRAPRHMVLTGIHANTRHKWWNSAKMKGEHMMMEEYECLIFFFSSGCSKEIAAAVRTLFFGGVAVHFTNDFGKDFVYIHLVPGWSFNEGTIPCLSQS